ncbi:endonuclease/exonuclease/phosphatase family protein [Ichthyenterobacterium sp. W332]|uniref:Endonuclease/exonuclease/phosphatase family protein n=1 Tax=Microcosmobacter mediterraneus TaxID=3075607 RepID=A0ABU2YJG5_9FLAO|nr:endonuclease/exonuclease/phosphatase family protein [Ichthyenterobacterium sp. W332]MDT0557203.1 endonuclease/exonuclease/phosphatase family protein [Ichthyenterobacterium sp. W332]
MKRLKLFDKVLFFVNSVVAAMLLLSYLLPYLEPKKFAALSVLSLAVPVLIILNVLFVVYWLLKVKRQLTLSLIVLIVGYSYVFSLYKFSSSKQIKDAANISVMNYNVRLFNLFNWIEKGNVKNEIASFITTESPDIICFQEYHSTEELVLEGYYKFEDLSGDKVKSGQAIYSKFPILNSGSVEFPKSSNNAIFIDALIAEDTLRIYNVHLQSSGINTKVENLKKESSENLFKRVRKTFKTQQMQMELFLKHKNKTQHKMVVCGDFNNTAYSYVYKEIKDDLQDTFEVAGNGFGRTFDFKLFPVRIDFILADPSFTVNSFKTYDVELSDHYPIKTELKLN